MSRCLCMLFGLYLVSAPLTARAADEDDGKKLLGEWQTVADGIEEGWLVSQAKDGKWKVIGQYRDAKTKKILGGFDSKNTQLKDGKVIFTQVWVKKPKSGWGDNASMTLEIVEETKLKYTWKLANGSSGSRVLSPIVRDKKR